MATDFTIPTGAALKWSQDPPTTSGAYWFREIADPEALPYLTMVLVSETHKLIRVAMAGDTAVHTIPLHEFDGQFRFCEFAGPLLGPGENADAERWAKLATRFDGEDNTTCERILRDLSLWQDGDDNCKPLSYYTDRAWPQS